MIIGDKKETVYELSDYHLKRLEESRQQFANSDLYIQEEINLELEKWSNEK